MGKSVITAVTVPHQVFLHDCLLEEGQSGLVSEDVLNCNPAFAMLVELWPVAGKING